MWTGITGYRWDLRPQTPPDAPVVVLANSLGSTLAMWDKQVDVLANDYRVLRYDLRGHGTSEVTPGPYELDLLVDDLHRLLLHEKVSSANIIGLSLGGMIALRLAVVYPESVTSLVVMCTAASPGPRQSWLDRAKTVRATGVSTIADAVLGRWFSSSWASENPNEIEAVKAMLLSTPAEGYAACAEAIAHLNLKDDLSRVVAPTLAIAGDIDPSTPPKNLREIAVGVADGTYAQVPGAHWANVENPAAVNTLILDFLSRPHRPR